MRHGSLAHPDPRIRRRRRRCKAESDLPRSAKTRSGLRCYSPKLGRWVSRDPIEERGGYHLYLAMINCPIGRADATGLTSAWTTTVSDGPFYLDDWKLSYRIYLRHALPPSIPPTASQVWQLVQTKYIRQNGDCTVEAGTKYWFDVWDLSSGVSDGGTWIPNTDSVKDYWSFLDWGYACQYMEESASILGFDDGGAGGELPPVGGYGPSDDFGGEDALAWMARMQGPYGGYTGTYDYIHPSFCAHCCSTPDELKGLPGFVTELLAFPGVGAWGGPTPGVIVITPP